MNCEFENFLSNDKSEALGLVEIRTCNNIQHHRKMVSVLLTAKWIVFDFEVGSGLNGLWQGNALQINFIQF